MERLKTYRTVVWLIAAILFVELGMLVVMLRPESFYLWMTIGIIALLCAYLVRVTLVLLKDLENKEKSK